MALARLSRHIMAIAHLSIRPHSRGAGHTVAAALAYRQGLELVDARSGEVHDYTRRSGIAATGFAFGDQAPAWDRDDPQAFADALESAETRGNARIARDVEVSLPHELTEAQRTALAQDWSQALSGAYAAPVAWAVHRPDRRGDRRNHHAHFLMATRRLGPDGRLGAKLRELDDRRTGPEQVVAMRLRWQEVCNAHLERAGLDARIAMGRLDDDATRLHHLGARCTGMERRAREKLGHAPVTELVSDGECVTDRGRALAAAVRTLRARGELEPGQRVPGTLRREAPPPEDARALEPSPRVPDRTSAPPRPPPAGARAEPLLPPREVPPGLAARPSPRPLEPATGALPSPPGPVPARPAAPCARPPSVSREEIARREAALEPWRRLSSPPVSDPPLNDVELLEQEGRLREQAERESARAETRLEPPRPASPSPDPTPASPPRAPDRAGAPANDGRETRARPGKRAPRPSASRKPLEPEERWRLGRAAFVGEHPDFEALRRRALERRRLRHELAGTWLGRASAPPPPVTDLSLLLPTALAACEEVARMVEGRSERMDVTEVHHEDFEEYHLEGRPLCELPVTVRLGFALSRLSAPSRARIDETCEEYRLPRLGENDKVTYACRVRIVNPRRMKVSYRWEDEDETRAVEVSHRGPPIHEIGEEEALAFLMRRSAEHAATLAEVLKDRERRGGRFPWERHRLALRVAKGRLLAERANLHPGARVRGLSRALALMFSKAVAGDARNAFGTLPVLDDGAVVGRPGARVPDVGFLVGLTIARVFTRHAGDQAYVRARAREARQARGVARRGGMKP